MTSSDEFVPLDLVQIQDILPHRYPFLLVDRVVEMERVSALSREKRPPTVFSRTLPELSRNARCADRRSAT